MRCIKNLTHLLNRLAFMAIFFAYALPEAFSLQQFVYHMKPNDLRGNYLLPLNQLKVEYPDLYTQAAAKYSWRLELMLWRIPILNCLWNDVVFFSPVNPAILRKALESVGATIRSLTWLKIPIENLRGLSTITLDGPPTPTISPIKPAAKTVKIFDVDSYHEIDEVPAWTMDYYRDEVGAGRRPLFFNGILHVLVRDKVSLENSSELAW